ncbi:aminotransferase [Thermococcus sp. MV5]|uniref:amylo-alpha-1,6-glucosidase n=1 Tax=Thermococcus sp. MV5 TaxID=1638272 RepID=UPI00143C9525|nr:amylo-alpha-1,6-glucosidase [Thermococcus sp. MV5]NJE25420.1 aminotransferase [Thermococcus sp. MV5]
MSVILSYNGAFVVTRENGDMKGTYDGFYIFDTRFLRGVRLKLNHHSVLIGASQEGSRKAYSHFSIGDRAVLLRKREIRDDWTYREEFQLYNTSKEIVGLRIEYTFKVPIEDVFEVRKFGGEKIKRRVKRSFKEESEYLYLGKDKIERNLKLKTNLQREKNMLFAEVTLEPLQKEIFYVEFSPRVSRDRLDVFLTEKSLNLPNLVSTNTAWLDMVFERAVEDLMALTAYTNYGMIPFAGIPYYACPFGRDSIITSWFLLPYYPQYAQGTLRFFAKIQGKKFDPRNEEEPGKIPHEFRFGELSHARRIPFAPYYGTVDATPLYIILASEYLQWSGDRGLIEKLKPNLTAAVEWVLRKLEEGGGYIRYKAGMLANQGWKDSKEGIPTEKGLPTKHPIALVEVQGYAYKALRDAALLELTFLDSKMLEREAKKLKKRFNKDFWTGNFYALALDGENNPSKVVSSNVGHLLFTGIAEHEKEISERLFEEDMFSGWGIRTLSSKEEAYNPFSYHNGSIWPHDNAVIALGLSLRREKEKVRILSEAVFKAAKLLPNAQLPELYSGLDSEYPLLCPRANAPQAWSAASVFAFLTALLGLRVDEKLIVDPSLPEGIRITTRVIFRGKSHWIKAKGKEVVRLEGRIF